MLVVVLRKKNWNGDNPDGHADGPRRGHDVAHTIADLDHYGRWLDPDYPFLRLHFHRRPRDEGIMLPGGLEVIGCFIGGSLLASYLSQASHAGMDRTQADAFEAAGFTLDLENTATLEQALRQHDQREVHHVNLAAGKTNVLAKEKYAAMLMHDVAEYFRMMSGKQFTLPRENSEGFREAMRTQYGIRLFRLSESALYATSVQAEEIRKRIFPDVRESPLDSLYRPVTPQPLGHGKTPRRLSGQA